MSCSIAVSRPSSLHNVNSDFVDFEEEKEFLKGSFLPSWAEMDRVPLEALYFLSSSASIPVAEALAAEETVTFDEASSVTTPTAFALLLDYMRASEYQNLPDFKAFFGGVTDSLAALTPKLEEVHCALETKERLERGPEPLSKEQHQQLNSHLSAVIQESLQPLASALGEVDKVITTYQDKLPSKKHEYYIRLISVCLTVMATAILAHIFAISVWWLSPIVMFGVLAVDTWKYYIQGKMEGWKDFKTDLETSRKYLKETKVMLDSAQLAAVQKNQAALEKTVLNGFTALGVRFTEEGEPITPGTSSFERSRSVGKGKAPADPDKYITKEQFEEYKAKTEERHQEELRQIAKEMYLLMSANTNNGATAASSKITNPA